MNSADQKTRARLIFRRLRGMYPDAKIELDFKTPLDLLVATVLSAQCTDRRVNKVTKALFKRCRKAEDYLKMPAPKLEAQIKSTGFFRQKAKSIREAARLLVEKHKGRIPQSMEELVKLPGVGRKTANVILGNAFGIPGLPVDTHVTRVSSRLALTRHSDPVKIESDLAILIPKKSWTLFSHTLIFHGRRTCRARSPLCTACAVSDLCPFFQQAVNRKAASLNFRDRSSSEQRRKA